MSNRNRGASARVYVAFSMHIFDLDLSRSVTRVFLNGREKENVATFPLGSVSAEEQLRLESCLSREETFGRGILKIDHDICGEYNTYLSKCKM